MVPAPGLPEATAAATERSTAIASPATAAASSLPSAAPPSDAPAAATTKRARWTRDAVIDELARWIADGSVVDAAFLTRYGPPGLVAATRRIFGRFDAALNLAGLRVELLFPPGSPQRSRLDGRRAGAGTTPGK